jgi:hypothetical protein
MVDDISLVGNLQWEFILRSIFYWFLDSDYWQNDLLEDQSTKPADKDKPRDLTTATARSMPESRPELEASKNVLGFFRVVFVEYEFFGKWKNDGELILLIICIPVAVCSERDCHLLLVWKRVSKVCPLISLK